MSQTRIEQVIEAARRDTPAPGQSGPPGIRFEVARRLDDVIDAWQMVYTAYRESGLIPPNPTQIHTAAQAVGPQASVILGCIDTLTVATLTAMSDSDQGLPLDRVYGPELQSLRQQGHSLVEVGLFADRRKQMARSTEALIQLMRYAFYFAQFCDATDFVIGVHPKHARFYTRLLGFQPCGPTRSYAAVNDRPVTLLRAQLDWAESLEDAHPAVRFFLECPVDGQEFHHRYPFHKGEVDVSPIAEFQLWHQRESQKLAAG